MPFYLNGLRYRPRQNRRSYGWLILILLGFSITGNVIQWSSRQQMQVQLNNAIISTDSTLAARHEAEQKRNRVSEASGRQRAAVVN